MDFNNPVTYGVSLAIVVACGSFIVLIFKVGEWKGQTDAVVKTFEEAIREFRADIKELRADVKELFRRLPDQPTSGGSPIRLTKMGQSISETLDADTWAKEHAQELVPRLNDRHPYEIQEFCKKYVKDEYAPPKDLEDKIKTCAYENALTIDQVLDFLAVVLRDVILQNSSD